MTTYRTAKVEGLDAAWTVSAGGDAARLDALTGAAVPEHIGRQRWALEQLIHASPVDETVAAR